MRAAASKFGIPSSTLHDHLKGKSLKRYGGAPTILTPDEEEEVVTACMVLQQLGFPLTKHYVSAALRDFLNETGRGDKFKGGLPQYDWWCGFFTRHPKLVERKPEHLPKNRAQASTPEVK